MNVNAYVRRKFDDDAKPDSFHVYPDGTVLAWHDLRFAEQWAEVFPDLARAKAHYGIMHLEPHIWDFKLIENVTCKGCVLCRTILPLEDTWDEHETGCPVATKMKQACV